MAIFRSRYGACAALLCGRLTAGAYAGDTYDFAVDPSASGLNATFAVVFDNSGTLIGAYEPDSNPTGTRTKPGLFGSFGETENVAVPIALDFGVSSEIATAPRGSFQATLDLQNNTIAIRNLGIDLLDGAAQALVATITLQTDSFRTRNPSSTFIGGFPISLPIAQAELLLLTAAQDFQDVAVGVLTPTGPGQYDFVVAVAATLAGEISVGGAINAFGPSPALLPLQGAIVIDGDLALLSSLQPLEFQQTQKLEQALPQIPLDLPTILPPGGVASVRLDLSLTGADSSLIGTQALTAIGTKQAGGLLGDLNCDGVATVSDIAPFVLALTDPAGYAAQFPDCNPLNADANGDGLTTVSDIAGFVTLLTE